MEMKRSALLKAAKELNDVIGFDKPIDLTLPADGLKLQLQLAKSVIAPDDVISEETLAVLEAVGDAKESDAPEDNAAPEDNGPDELLQILAGPVKLKDLKDMVAENECFKKLRKTVDNYQGLQGPKLLKAEMVKLLGGAAPKATGASAPGATSQKSPAAPKAPAAPKVKKPGRIQCSVAAIKAQMGKTCTKTLLTEDADLRCAEAGGGANIKEAIAVMRQVLTTMEALELLSVTGENVTISKF